MRMMFLIRGLLSSGKSTLGGGLFFLGEEPRNFEADSYFYVDVDGSTMEKKYKFDPAKLADAHRDCQMRVERAMETSDRNVVVSNTFSQRWEMEPYISMAKKFGWKLMVIDLFDAGCDDDTLFERNAHDVPIKSFARMREHYEHAWSGGDPNPPWERESKE